MTDGSPAELLDQIHRLRRHTRARVHGAGLPLTVFALLTLASTLLYTNPFYFPHMHNVHLADIRPRHGYSGLPWSDRSAEASIAFWLIAAPLCYLGCAWWYRRRAERLGVAMRWQPWTYVGLGLLAVVIGVMAARSSIPFTGPGPVSIQNRVGAMLSPLLAVTVGLLALAWVERSWGVAVTAMIYGLLSTTMNANGFGEMPPIRALNAVGPKLILLASVLLLGAACMQLQAMAQRRQTRQPAFEPA